MASRSTVEVRSSNFALAILATLKSEGFVSSFVKDGYMITVELNPDLPVTHVKRLSRPSIRRFVGYHEIPKPKSGLGTIVVSTPKGVLTGNQARKQKVGGELICEIW